MKAINFPEVNVEIAKNQPQYATLPSYINRKTGLVVNCFEISDLEIEIINAYKKIWIHHFTGGVLQPFNIVAVNDYFSSVIHKDGKFVVEEEEIGIEKEVERLLNSNNVTTPMQSLFVHMAQKYKMNLNDQQLFEIAKICKDI